MEDEAKEAGFMALVIGVLMVIALYWS